MAYGYLYICNELIIYTQVTITDVYYHHYQRF